MRGSITGAKTRPPLRRSLFWILGLLLLCGCDESDVAGAGSAVHLASGGRVKTLDPALADDLASRDMVAAFYDTLLEYDYVRRPYRLIPSMLAAMPEVNATHDEFRFRLRGDLYFPEDPCFAGLPREMRRIRADDVLFSLKRLADARLHSSSFWMVRGKIAGLERFRERSERASPRDLSIYDAPVSGLQKLGDLEFTIRLNAPDPHFLYLLALPNLAVVSRRAVAYYGEEFAEHPVGSGPFLLQEWIRNYRLILTRNPEYRRQYFSEAANPADRTRALPLADQVVCYQIRQPFSSWLLFLQGELDISAVDKDNLDLVAGDGRVTPALQERGVELLKSPAFEMRYIGFNFLDPLLLNVKLRRAISLAFDVGARVRHMNNLLIPSAGPLPPDVNGFDPSLKNPYLCHDLTLARKLLAEAGYPEGIDPRTGAPLELTFDQGNNTSAQRQLGELMAADLAQIGIRVRSVLNSAPRFVEKLRQGKTQLFLYSWVGDYPDAENFLQLFYSRNAGGCNRTAFSDREFDRMYEQAYRMADSPERTDLYQRMVRHLIPLVPWIYEGVPVSYQLKYSWLENYLPHDFAFCRWKYLAVRADLRKNLRRSFRPLKFRDLRSGSSREAARSCRRPR